MSAWRCRHGWHSWYFVSQADTRLMSIPGHSSWLCTLTTRCRRCGITRVERGAAVPKRTRVK